MTNITAAEVHSDAMTVTVRSIGPGSPNAVGFRNCSVCVGRRDPMAPLPAHRAARLATVTTFGVSYAVNRSIVYRFPMPPFVNDVSHPPPVGLHVRTEFINSGRPA